MDKPTIEGDDIVSVLVEIELFKKWKYSWNRATSRNNNLYTRDKCRSCFAKLYCSGGCAANNFHTNGDINKVYDFGCELHKKRIECALMLKVAEEELGIERVSE